MNLLNQILDIVKQKNSPEFVYGDVTKEQQISNYQLFKDYINKNGSIRIDGKLEIWVDTAIICNDVTIYGTGEVICYPYEPIKGVNLKVFHVPYGGKFFNDGVNFTVPKPKLYETYSCNFFSDRIEVIDPLPGFNPSGDVFYSWATGVKGQSNEIDHVEDNIVFVKNPISLTGSGKVGFYFTNLDNYDSGDYWYLNEGINCISHEMSNSEQEIETVISLRDCIISGFNYNVLVSSKDCKLNFDNVVLEKAQISCAFFGMDTANYQTITVRNGLTLRDNGYKIAGGIVSGTAYNILGSGLYAHPNIIVDIDNLILKNNKAAAFRQYSGSGPKAVRPDYISKFGKIIASGNAEYDVMFSSSMPTIVDYIDSNVIYMGYNTTINGGIIRWLNCVHHSQPLSSLDNFLQVSNCQIKNRQYLSFNANRNERTTIIYDNCDIEQFSTQSHMFVCDVPTFKHLIIRNSRYVVNDIWRNKWNSIMIRLTYFSLIEVENLSAKYTNNELIVNDVIQQ